MRSIITIAAVLMILGLAAFGIRLGTKDVNGAVPGDSLRDASAAAVASIAERRFSN